MKKRDRESNRICKKNEKNLEKSRSEIKKNTE